MESKQTIKLHCLESRTASGYVTFGSYWEKGTLVIPNFKNDGMDSFVLQNENKESIPVQSRITAWWPDGSIKWVAHTADASKMGQEAALTAQIKSGEVSEETAELVSMIIRRDDNWLYIDNGVLSLKVPTGKYKADTLAEDIFLNGKLRVKKALPVLYLEEQGNENSTNFDLDGQTKVTRAYKAAIKAVTIEEDGPLALTIKAEGSYQHQNQNKMKFCIRMYINKDSSDIRFVHTFFFDGDEQTDFLKGLGIRFDTVLEGRPYEHHIRFAGELPFKEAAILLNSSYPRLQPSVLKKQLDGKTWGYPADSDVEKAAADLPVWNRYFLYQDSADHYRIGKQTKPQCCVLSAAEGRRAHGAMEVCGENGGILLGIRDFWQKYPSAVEAGDLDQDNAEVIFWLWCPQVEAMDFRHYADQGYSQTYYEGFDVVGASAYGIGNTNNFSIELSNNAASDGDALKRFSDSVQKPPVYVADPSVYEKLQAFGEWSLPSKKTQVERFLEEQLDKAFDFYKNEVEVRSWYGMFNYGDIMHTYDPFRHSWRYDMGGYAWQNTELVPTLWLWLAFMRSGREDIFTMAEAMSRHCSEVDIYHFGPLKGLGSRHNVRHWGCSCKEARIAMAGHHRFYYYLTGDMRLGDVFDDVKDADEAIVTTDPLRFFFDKDKMNAPAHARSGPDWSSFCSDWMTQWERFNDYTYRNKIQIGIDDLKALPLRLTSGPDFEYDPKDSHLRYIGERTNGGSHLQVCMGAIQVWIEIADLLGDEEWKDMLAEHGRFYYLPKEKQLEESNGLIGNREFSLPFMASGLAAYGAARLHDKWLAQTTWKILLHALCTHNNTEGFLAHDIFDAGNKEVLHEIPWITTNFTSQWCLNIITALRYIREDLPKTMEELEKLLAGLDESGFHKA